LRAIQHDCTDADKCSAADLHAASDMYTWRQRCIIADLYVMRNCAANINLNVVADDNVGCDDGSCRDDNGSAQDNLISNDRRLVTYPDDIATGLSNSINYTNATMWIADCRNNARLWISTESFRVGPDGQSIPDFTTLTGIVIYKADGVVFRVAMAAA
jgi:hypothetical protein